MAASISRHLFSTFLASSRRLVSPPPLSNLRSVRSLASSAAAKLSSTATTQPGPRGLSKPLRVSREMQAFVGVPEIARTQALKLIWAYIKEHKLQDPENKKIIICDKKLKGIFAGKDRVGFLEVAGLISPHFLK